MPGKEVIAAIRNLPGKAEVQWQRIDDERYLFAFGMGAFIGGFCALPLLYGDLQLRKVVPRRCGSSAQTEARMPPRRMACLPAREFLKGKRLLGDVPETSPDFAAERD